MALSATAIKETANAHMRRDLETGPAWVCACEACVGARSLTGVEKVLDIRPLVRRIEALEEELQALPPGPQQVALRTEYEKLHDELADVMAR